MFKFYFFILWVGTVKYFSEFEFFLVFVCFLSAFHLWGHALTHMQTRNVHLILHFQFFVFFFKSLWNLPSPSPLNRFFTAAFATANKTVKTKSTCIHEPSSDISFLNQYIYIRTYRHDSVSTIFNYVTFPQQWRRMKDEPVLSKFIRVIRNIYDNAHTTTAYKWVINHVRTHESSTSILSHIFPYGLWDLPFYFYRCWYYGSI